jgi:predicted deacylase
MLCLILLCLTIAICSPSLVQPAFAAYRDYTTFIESFKSLQTAYPTLVSYEVVGNTVKGQSILMFKIGNPNGGKVLIDGAIHGNEHPGSELLYFFAKWLLTSSDPLAKRILTRNYVLLIPAVNVDNYGKARKNANGVDLNRNFATGWESSGSTNPSSEYYRGSAPLSEPESQTLVRVFKKWKPSFYINLHTGDSILYGSKYCNSEYYSDLYQKMVELANQRQVASYPFQSIYGKGYALSDAAQEGITSFLLELFNAGQVTYQEVQTTHLQKFIQVAAVLCEESARYLPEFEDGFETGNFNAWSGLMISSGGKAAVSNVKPYKGVYSARFETAAISSGTIRACVYKKIDETSIVYARAYFYIDAGLPLNDNDDRITLIQILGSNGGIIANLQIRRVNGKDSFAILAYDKLASTTAVYPQTKTWYCLDFYIKIDSAQGVVKAYVNGVERISITNINTARYGKVSVIRFGLANSINVQHNVITYCDSAKISTSYIGPLPEMKEGSN